MGLHVSYLQIELANSSVYALTENVVVAGGVTVYALGDMMIYNRRKRAEFFAEQKAKHEIAIYDAKVAMEYGNATEAQLEFMKRENAEQARVDALRREKINDVEGL